jgi:outer membrane protein OmpA-like peptidoglycan-associated protein
MSQERLTLTPDALQTYNRWHLIVGLVLVLLLFVLPLMGLGPSSWRSCCNALQPPTSAAATPAATPAAPTATTAPVAAPIAAATAPKAAVFFETGQAAVNAAGKDALKQLVAQSGSTARFAVSGFHDAKGDPAANAELAKRRAMAVRDALGQLGVAADRVELRKPEATSAATGPQADAQARRVEVTALPGM